MADQKKKNESGSTTANSAREKKRLPLIVLGILVLVILVNVVFTLSRDQVGPLKEEIAKQQAQIEEMQGKFASLSEKVGQLQAITNGIVGESAAHDKVLRAGYDLYKAQLKYLNDAVGEMGQLLGDVPQVPANDEAKETAPVIVEALKPEAAAEAQKGEAPAPEVKPDERAEEPAPAEAPAVEVKKDEAPAPEVKPAEPAVKSAPAEAPAAEVKKDEAPAPEVKPDEASVKSAPAEAPAAEVKKDEAPEAKAAESAEKGAPAEALGPGEKQ
ncbi:hypothetical protein JonanDRAFT_1502 [Jonquetella anthropi DSM 22815]|uniref:Uncharacterized protein n=1 Tax=Jonquetella anthropi DSM 22815 TaxID=885272 RepID=H0UJ37_9BACT|nr:hypothetical protein [Jonquetella anthropi]EEX49077.1 hypothetical protein GCWU000246_00163 [Jonquetella anthropi E3_33 E1]EHM13864.1 hypothetical protein JonanDRAFT_1502 [Jonquetella anthropi DSM 22815]